MNAQELIGSGLLEAYVLGQALPEEALLVERYRANDLAVRSELEAIELALEKYASLRSVDPPVQVKRTIWQRTGTNDPRTPSPIIRETRRGSTPKLNWLAAASLAGLVLSGSLNLLLYNELHEVREEFARLESDRSVLVEDLNAQRTALERTTDQLAVALDPRADVVRLDGMGDAIGTSARVYWDKDAHAVHCDLQAMPAPPVGMQYQLWALLDGRPINAGVIERDVDGLQRMKDVPAAQAFAVTMEQAGGSPTPNLAALVLMGQV